MQKAKLMRVLFSIVLFISSFTLYAREKHHTGLGVNAYFFFEDLQDQFNNTLGISSEYEYSFFQREYYDIALGSRFEVYYPIKDGFQNLNILISPEISSTYYTGAFGFGGTLAFDTLYWRQSKKFIIRNTTLEELDFGTSFGIFSKFRIYSKSSIKVMALYHFQENNAKTTYLSVGAMYVWHL